MFKPSVEWTRNVHLDWLENLTPTAMAEAFKEAADATIERSETDLRHPDRYFFPVMYLYRHYLELELKNIIEAGQRVVPQSVSHTNANGHQLAVLWKNVVAAIDVAFPEGERAVLKPVEAAIQQMDAADPDGQSFRYYRDRKGKVNLTHLPRVISLREMQRAMDVVFSFLSGCSAGVITAAEYRDEMRAEARNDHG